MFKRPNYFKQLIQFKDADFIKVITGVHRSGKSVLLTLYKEYLLQEGVQENHIIHINFESSEYQNNNNRRKIPSKIRRIVAWRW